MRLFAFSLALFALTGCGDDKGVETAPGTGAAGGGGSTGAGCDIGELTLEDGSCDPAGLPSDMPCAPGELELDDGSCLPAGVPADGCDDGFTHDGDSGCTPLLPASACAAGTMAIPGEVSCRAIAPCASGKWGDIPIDTTTQHVDASYDINGGASDGTAAHPWLTVQEGVDAATDGAIVAIAAGSYLEDVYVTDKTVRLWGACPDTVEIDAAGGTSTAAVLIGANANGSEVRNLAARGPRVGVQVSGSEQVVLEDLWLHDCGRGALDVQDFWGPTEAAVSNVLAEDNNYGAWIEGATITIEGSVFRNHYADSNGDGRGLHVLAGMGGRPSSMTVRRSLVSNVLAYGVFVAGATAVIDGSVIRRTGEDSAGAFGRGINAQPDQSSGVRATLTLRGSVLDGNHSAGLFAAGADVQVERTVIRNTQPSTAGGPGRGIEAGNLGDATQLSVLSSLFADNAHAGITGFGSTLELAAVAVRDTAPGPFDDGAGVTAERSSSEVSSTLDMRGSRIERNSGQGILVVSSSASIDATLVRDTQPNGEGFGYGIAALYRIGTQIPSELVLRRSQVERNIAVNVAVGASNATIEQSVVRGALLFDETLGGHGLQVQAGPDEPAATMSLRGVLAEDSTSFGIFVVSAEATIDSSVVRNTMASPATLFGDGIGVDTNFGPASALVENTRIEDSARAALFNAGGTLQLARTRMVCQQLDINGETFMGMRASLEDLGDNLCGCPEATDACKTVSTGVQPPDPL